MLVLSFPSSKGAKRSGSTEFVAIQDRTVVTLAAHLLHGRNPDAPIFQGSWRSLSGSTTKLAASSGVQDPALRHIAFVWGGATWFFVASKSYDLTQEHGRWNQSRTARQYIDQAYADVAYCATPPKGMARLHACSKVFRHLVDQKIGN